MGREKGALPWLGGQPLLWWMLEALRRAEWQPVVVVRPEFFDFWRAEIPREVIVAANPDPERGKTTSLAVGLRQVPVSAEWLLITSVDQPVRPEWYRRLREETAPARILAPARGHPIVLAGSFREQLLALDERSLGLRGLLQAHAKEIHRLPDMGEPRWDLNTPAEYEMALAWFKKAPPGET